ncbi:MAG: hypothetical protein L6R39_003357 [Caloplaca ligustica]|nr:MAG: hypothetical protein L6R39_003357 [Caloplaca ligustica]
MANLVACNVKHCDEAQAVCVTFPTGFKFSYSGDCRPSKQFTRIGYRSTVLVHEATFEDDMQGDAEAKRHSTMREAICVAQAMKAKRLILTHFSQRYQKIPELGSLDDTNVKFDDEGTASSGGEDMEVAVAPEVIASATSSDQRSSVQWKSTRPPSKVAPKGSGDLNVAIAFDFLRVRVKDIAYLERLTPILQRMFELSKEADEADAKDNPGEPAKKQKEGKKAGKKEKGARKTKKHEDTKEKDSAESDGRSQEVMGCRRVKIKRAVDRETANVEDTKAKERDTVEKRVSTRGRVNVEDSEAVVVERGTAGRLNDGYGPESVQGDDDGEVGGNVGSDTGNGESALPLSSAEVPQAGPTSKKPFESAE